MRKIISGVLSCVFLFFAIVGFASCNHEKNIAYNAIPIGGRLKESFLNKEENRIKIAYKNENYNPNDPNSEQYVCDLTLPSYRVIIVTESTHLSEIFENAPVIDFETKMLVIILFSMFGSASSKLEYIEKKDDVLEITIKKRQTGMATAPYLVYQNIQLDKLKIRDCIVFFTK